MTNQQKRAFVGKWIDDNAMGKNARLARRIWVDTLYCLDDDRKWNDWYKYLLEV